MLAWKPFRKTVVSTFLNDYCLFNTMAKKGDSENSKLPTKGGQDKLNEASGPRSQQGNRHRAFKKPVARQQKFEGK
jgi:hypothetical protein